MIKQSVQNVLEQREGALAWLTTGDVLQRRQALDAKITAWASEPGRDKIKSDIGKMETILAQARATARADFDRQVALRGSRLLSAALELVRVAHERPKKDADRKLGYQDRDMPLLLARQKGFAGAYDKTLDQAFFKLALIRAARLPAGDRPWLGRILGIKDGRPIDEAVIDAALTKMYAATGLADEKLRMDLLQNGTMAGLRAARDPFIRAALAVWPVVRAQEEKSEARESELLLVRPAYAGAMRAVLRGFLVPDANATLRITYGTVKGFAVDSGKAPDRPITTADQIPAKDTRAEPFNAPEELLNAIRARNYGPYGRPELGGELPVDFLSDLDITGGNSGSATLNGKGELVGLAFDGTIAVQASEVVFDGDLSRAVSTDARYMLWIMDAVDGADHLLEEMGIKPALQRTRNWK